jgi:hypothetical protein
MSQSIDLTPEERAKLVAARASVKYGPYASLHEAYGVLAEELHEMVMAVLHANDDLNRCSDLFRDIMSALHANDAGEVRHLADKMRAATANAHAATINLSHELIDVMAVCQRIIEQYGGES